jgi:FlaA1/EpsC-like NDP-sugar epimerase
LEVHLMRRVLIYGAGEAGEMVLGEVNKRPEENIRVLGFLDDNPSKHCTSIRGISILGGKSVLGAKIRELSINEVIIAMPSIEKNIIRDIVRICMSEKVKLLIVPSTREIIDGSVSFDQLKRIDLSDLLEREEVDVQSDKVQEYIEGRNVLVTGAAGSIGSQLVYKLLRFRPRQLVALDINENGLFYLYQDLMEKSSDQHTLITPCVSDIKNIDMLEELFSRFRPGVVFHAAAYKHVPLMEANVRMIFLNNVIGTLNLLRLSRYYNTQRFIGISTDKAVRPLSVMGKTKRIGELLVKDYARSGLVASSVRFGNVLGSNGSVITVFKRQIERGGPVTITSPQMERYFMTIDEATMLVLQAGCLDGNGDVYVLDMGDPIRIRDLAENLIVLSGLSPGGEIKINYTGIRAGEKLREELFYNNNEKNECGFKGIYRERICNKESKIFRTLESATDKLFLMEEDGIIRLMDNVIATSLNRVQIGFKQLKLKR